MRGYPLVVLALVCTPANGAAQGDPGPRTVVRSAEVFQSMEEAGRAAAEQPSVVGNFAVPFLGAFALGLGSPVLVAAPEYALVGVPVAGLTVGFIHAAYHHEAQPPPSTIAAWGPVSEEEVRTFREAYARHLTRRRVRASFWGAGLGLGAGIGVLLWAVSNMTWCPPPPPGPRSHRPSPVGPRSLPSSPGIRFVAPVSSYYTHSRLSLSTIVTTSSKGEDARTGTLADLVSSALSGWGPVRLHGPRGGPTLGGERQRGDRGGRQHRRARRVGRG